jgi:hypothetical protein
LRFYLQQIIWDAGYNWASAAHQLTNYVVLADAIERWRSENNEEVTYITSNYDLILEEALRPFIRFRAFDDYVTGPTKLIKAHGSVDWGHATTMPTKVAGGDLRELLVHEAPERALDAVGWYRFSAYSNSHPAGGRQATSELLYPALALPTTGKAGFECPPDHIEAMEAALAQVSRMLVIGWRAQEQHLLGLLDRVDREVQAQVVTSNAETATTIAQFIERGDLDSLLGYDRV